MRAWSSHVTSDKFYKYKVWKTIGQFTSKGTVEENLVPYTNFKLSISHAL